MKNNMRFLGLFSAIVALLPGCMRVSSYKCKSLKLISNNFAYRSAEKNVIMRAKKLSLAEKNYLFDARMHNNDLQVIYISIHNLSDEVYVFSHDGVTAQQILYPAIIRSMKKTSTISRFVGVGVGATVIASPNIAIACLYSKGCGIPAIAILPFWIAAVIAVPLGVAFLVQGIKSLVMNSRIKKDITEKMLHGSVIIPSGEQYEGLIFIQSSDDIPEFTVTLHEKDTMKNSITFDVDVSQNERQEE